MTAETPIDNSEGILSEDNLEGIEHEDGDAYGDEEESHEVSNSEPSEDGDSFWGGNPEELPVELKSVYKNMQAAFTKRQQRLAALENKYFESIDAANAAVLARSQQPPTQDHVEEEAPEPPQLDKGAKPEDVIQHYVNMAVKEAIEGSGIKNIAKEIQPVAHRERVVSAYKAYAEQNPDLDHQQLAPLAGRIIDSDSELSELAQVNPSAAIRLATRIASAEIKATATKQKNKKRRQAAPVAARNGTPVKRRRESMLDAATRALKEAGLNADSF
tara:strand:+ start:12828 stop:13646 length:819 start_codon:yes stop_codon:yes gene_type:complete